MKADNKHKCLVANLLLHFVLFTGFNAAIADDEFDYLLGLSLSELSQVDITGSTLLKESLLSVPASVTVFTGSEIRRMGISDLEHLLNYVPGFQSSRTDAGGNIYSFSARGWRGREVLVLLDGQRLFEVFAGSASIPLLSLEHVARVEVIRGPSSALYGSNAFLGVVNIITDKSLNNMELAANSFDGGHGYINYSYAKDELRLSSFVKYFEDNGDHYTAFDTINGGFSDTRDPRAGSDLYFSADYKAWSFNLSHTTAAGAVLCFWQCFQ